MTIADLEGSKAFWKMKTIQIVNLSLFTNHRLYM